MEKEESNGGAPSNAMWGNTSWGMAPYWNQQKAGASGMDVAALVLGIAGTAFGLMSGGLGLFNRNGGPNGNGQGGPNVMDRLAAVEAQLAEAREQIAVNTATDNSTKELTAALIDNAKKDAEIKTLESERRLDRRIDDLQTAVVTNAGTIACVQNNLNKLIQIGIPSANIITPPTATTATSTAGA